MIKIIEFIVLLPSKIFFLLGWLWFCIASFPHHAIKGKIKEWRYSVAEAFNYLFEL